ncbi:MAG: HAD hydrolase-like protein [Clostridia bacterium]|nr:HAD hydrolase-like protein [Clostridia bacterium]
MKKKLVLFDFDGTVVDNSEGIYNCIRYALDKKGMKPLSEEILRKFIGPSLFDSFMWHCTDDETVANELVALYRERYAPIGSTELIVFDGIKELLARLREEGYKTAVCSSKPYDFVRKIAEEQGLQELFDGFFCPGFSSHVSDKSGLALEAVSHFGVKKEETVLIGDTRFDISAARDAEIECIGVLYGFSEDGEMDAADYISPDVKGIYPIIAGEN